MNQLLKSLLLSTLVLLLAIDRLPAPIQESQETPSPSPTSQASVTPSASAPGIPSRQEAAQFAGTWTGKIKFGGNADAVEFTLIINPEATSMIQNSPRFGQFTHPTTVNAGALSWTAGVKNGNTWTLTPNPDGRTALVKVKPVNGEEGIATFQRAPSSVKPTPAPIRKYPGAKAKHDSGD